jgi:Fe-S-cluster-containing hydrogenase component 2
LERIILIDPEKCLACASCMMECARVAVNAEDIYQAVRRTPQSRLSVQTTNGFSFPIMCRQCRVNPCIEVCSTGAIRKREDGVVVIDDAKCIGCKSCFYACPIGAIYLDKNFVTKCELCIDTPPCVAACKTGALKYGEYHDIAIERGVL